MINLRCLNQKSLRLNKDNLNQKSEAKGTTSPRNVQMPKPIAGNPTKPILKTPAKQPEPDEEDAKIPFDHDKRPLNIKTPSKTIDVNKEPSQTPKASAKKSKPKDKQNIKKTEYGEFIIFSPKQAKVSSRLNNRFKRNQALMLSTQFHRTSKSGLRKHKKWNDRFFVTRHKQQFVSISS